MNSVFGYSRRYSPLEQIEGTGTDTRSDLFALGATVFHLLTGTPPVDVLARASAIVAGQPDPLRLASDLNPTVPLSFSKIIMSSLELNADKRFLSAAAMKNALEFAVAGDTAGERGSGQHAADASPG
jgi:serine/threonine protein kinase